MKLAPIFALVSFFVLFASAGQAEDLPFSQMLTPAERSGAGIDKLSGQQIAILDALVAREEPAPADFSNPTPLLVTGFSHELAPDKRHSAGLYLLTPSELTRLDDLVQKQLSGKMTKAASAKTALKPEEITLQPQIHGETGLMFAVGSHGYSAYGGYLALNYNDPAKGYAVSALYSETHVKGAGLNSACLDENCDPKLNYLERDASVTLSFGHQPWWQP